MEYFFENRNEASVAAAGRIAAALKRAIEDSSDAIFIATGGSSPLECYRILSAAKLGWSEVRVLLSDERWVAADHEDSNERMLRSKLLTGPAADAMLLGVHSDSMTAEARSKCLSTEIAALPTPYATCLLGMGADGHIASLFADAPNYEAAIETASDTLCIATETAASEHARISLTLSALLRSKEIILLFFGDEKLTVYDRAMASPTAYPVSRLLHQNDVPVSVYWAP